MQEKEEISIIKESYNKRLESIFSNLQKVLDNVQQDELILTMRSEPTSNQFVNLRISEMFYDAFNKEREIYVQQQIEQNALLNSELKRLKSSIRQSEQNLQDMIAKNSALESSMQKLRTQNVELNDNLREITQQQNIGLKQREIQYLSEIESFKLLTENQISELNEALQIKEDQLAQQEECIKQLNNQNTQLNRKNKVLTQNIQELQELNSSAMVESQQYQQNIDQLKNTLNNIETEIRSESFEKENVIQIQTQAYQQLQKENYKILQDQQSFKSKSKAKIKQLKNKIIEQKERLKQQTQQISEENSKRNKSERQILTLQKELEQLRSYWQQKIDKNKQEFELEIQQLHSAYENQYLNVQSRYQQIIEQKLQIINSEFFQEQQKKEFQAKELHERLISQLQNTEQECLYSKQNLILLQEQMDFTKQKQEEQIKDIQNEFDLTINSKIKELESEKHACIQDLQKQIQELQQKCIQLKKQSEEQQKNTLEVSQQGYEELCKNADQVKSQLVQEIQQKDEIIFKQKQSINEEQNKNRRLNEEINSLETLMENEGIKFSSLQNEFEEQIKQASNQIQSLQYSLQDQSQVFLKKNSELQKELENSRQEIKNLQIEKESLKTDYEELETTLEDKINDLNQQKNELNEELFKVTQEFKNLHLSAIIQKDELNNIKQINAQIKKSDQQKEENINQYQSQIRQFQQQCSSLQMQCIENQNTFKQKQQLLEAKMEQKANQIQKLKKKIIGNVRLVCKQQRNALNQIKSFVVNNFVIANKELSVQLQEFILVNNEKLRALKRVMLTKFETKIGLIQQKKEETDTEYQNQIQDIQKLNDEQKLELETQNVQLENENQYLEQKIAQQNLCIEEYQFQIIKEQDRCRELEKQKNLIEMELQELQMTFENLTKEVKDETDKIKKESDNLLEITYQELDKRNQDQLQTVHKELEISKNNFNEQMLLKEQQINNLQDEIQTQLIQQKQRLELMFNKQIEETVSFYKTQIRDLYDQFSNLQNKQKKKLSNLEDQVESLATTLKYDSEICKNSIHEKLEMQLAQVTRELRKKNLYCEELKFQNESAHVVIKDLKSQVNNQYAIQQ